MKIMKTYRFYPFTIEKLEKLKEMWPQSNETGIIEEAINMLYYRTLQEQKEED